LLQLKSWGWGSMSPAVSIIIGLQDRAGLLHCQHVSGYLFGCYQLLYCACLKLRVGFVRIL
jgi:hypothetical protein